MEKNRLLLTQQLNELIRYTNGMKKVSLINCIKYYQEISSPYTLYRISQNYSNINEGELRSDMESFLRELFNIDLRLNINSPIQLSLMSKMKTKMIYEIGVNI